VHDYNPGYLGGWPSGVFWTIPVRPDEVEIDASAGTARYRMKNYRTDDYGSFTNSIANGDRTPGVVSFDVRWSRDATSKKYSFSHAADVDPDSYQIDYWDTRCTLEWESRNDDGFRFSSYRLGRYPAGKAPGQLFAIVGSEKNGVFFDT
jgi:hypothetical protein